VEAVAPCHFLNVFVLFLVINTIRASIICPTQTQWLWNQSLPISDANDYEFGTVALSRDCATVFATVYGSSYNGPSFLVGTECSGI